MMRYTVYERSTHVPSLGTRVMRELCTCVGVHRSMCACVHVCRAVHEQSMNHISLKIGLDVM